MVWNFGEWQILNYPGHVNSSIGLWYEKCVRLDKTISVYFSERITTDGAYLETF